MSTSSFFLNEAHYISGLINGDFHVVNIILRKLTHVNKKMSWTSLYEHAASCSVEDFYSGVDVWLKRPNVVNKRLLGAVIVAEDDKISTECTLEIDDDGMVRGRHASMAVLAELYCRELQRAGSEDNSEVQSTVLLKGMVRELLPKMRSSSRGLEAVLTDLSNHSVIFCPLSGAGSGLEEGAVPTAIPACSYRLQFSSKTDTDNISPSRYNPFCNYL